MDYTFKCNKCATQHVIEMRLTSYTPYGHMCPVCGEELERDINDYATSVQWKCSGAYVTNNN